MSFVIPLSPRSSFSSAPLSVRQQQFNSRCLSSSSSSSCSALSSSLSSLTFPQRLMSILLDAEELSNSELNDIITWLPHGKSFFVKDRDRFTSELIPKYFESTNTGREEQTNFRSFTRRLLRWGFKRVPRGDEVGAFYHEHFLRDQPELCSKIKPSHRSIAAVPATLTKGENVTVRKGDMLKQEANRASADEAVSLTKSKLSSKVSRDDLAKSRKKQKALEIVSSSAASSGASNSVGTAACNALKRKHQQDQEQQQLLTNAMRPNSSSIVSQASTNSNCALTLSRGTGGSVPDFNASAILASASQRRRLSLQHNDGYNVEKLLLQHELKLQEESQRRQKKILMEQEKELTRRAAMLLFRQQMQQQQRKMEEMLHEEQRANLLKEQLLQQILLEQQEEKERQLLLMLQRQQEQTSLTAARHFLNQQQQQQRVCTSESDASRHVPPAATATNPATNQVVGAHGDEQTSSAAMDAALSLVSLKMM